MRFDRKLSVFTLLVGFVLVPLMNPHAQSVSVGDAIDLAENFKEATVAAYGVNEKRQCKEGRLIFANQHRVLITDLDGRKIRLPDGKRTIEMAFSEEPSKNGDGIPHLVQDNHLVKLRDGSLVLSVLGVTWNDNVVPHPYWWEMTKNFELKERKIPGGRAIAYFFRSEDCGIKWERVGEIDAAKLSVPIAQTDVASLPTSVTNLTVDGYFGVPRLKTKDDAFVLSAGGWDGHYLYADPYTGNLFFSSIGIRGLSTNKDNMSSRQGEQPHHIVAISKNQGRTWSVCLLAYGSHSFRAPVSSLPTGEVAVAYPSDDGNFVLTILTPPYNKPIIISSTNRNQFTVLRKRALYNSGKIVTLPENDDPKTISSFNTDSEGDDHVISTPDIAPVLSAAGGPGFIVARNLWTKRRAVDRYTLAQGLFFVPKSLALNWKLSHALTSTMVLSPRVTPHENGDTFHGTLIAGLPIESLNVFYWVENNRDVLPEQFSVKFMVLNGLKPINPGPGELTVSNNVRIPWRIPTPMDWVGDYMSGTSFRSFKEKKIGNRLVHEDDGKRHFVATWNEAGTLKFNIITVDK